jgi:uncharacterized protein YuzE
MRVHYDAEADALYLRLAEALAIESEEVRPGTVFDFDLDGRVVAIEILDICEHLESGIGSAPHSA